MIAEILYETFSTEHTAQLGGTYRIDFYQRAGWWWKFSIRHQQPSSALVLSPAIIGQVDGVRHLSTVPSLAIRGHVRGERHFYILHAH